MKRISSILTIFLVISAVAMVAVSAGAQDNGNSTINETTTVEPTHDTSANVSDGNDDAAQADVINDTNVTVTPKPVNNVTVTPKPVNNGTNATVTPKPNSNATVTPKPNSNATVTPKPTPGTVPIKVVDKTNVNVVNKNNVNVIVPQKSTTAKPTVPQTKKVGKVTTIDSNKLTYTNVINEGVQITALHPLSDGVEYVSITNFNDFTAHLEGYKIHEMTCNNTIVFKDIDVLPGHTLKVYTGSHPDGPDIVGTHKLHHIYNQHDTVELICACENLISVFEQ